MIAHRKEKSNVCDQSFIHLSIQRPLEHETLETVFSKHSQKRVEICSPVTVHLKCERQIMAVVGSAIADLQGVRTECPNELYESNKIWQCDRLAFQSKLHKLAKHSLAATKETMLLCKKAPTNCQLTNKSKL